MSVFLRLADIGKGSNTNEPTFAFEDGVSWQMSRWERYTMYSILSSYRPDLSIEVGTFQGGSLDIISKFSRKVISIDKDPKVGILLSNKYKNTEFIAGTSQDYLSNSLENLTENSRNFVLLDGDHSEEGILSDIECLINFNIKTTVLILIHDSFNLECRRGIVKAPWSENSRVQFVDIDFVPGTVHEEKFDQAGPYSMWGGFACALILPDERQHDLVVRQSQRLMIDTLAAGLRGELFVR